MIIGVLTNSLFFFQEMIQLKDYGALKYFQTTKNVNEFSVFFIFTVFAILRLSHPNLGSLVPDNFKDLDREIISI